MELRILYDNDAFDAALAAAECGTPEYGFLVLSFCKLKLEIDLLAQIDSVNRNYGTYIKYLLKEAVRQGISLDPDAVELSQFLDGLDANKSQLTTFEVRLDRVHDLLRRHFNNLEVIAANANGLDRTFTP